MLFCTLLSSLFVLSIYFFISIQGLQVGDKILEVNGHNFHNITHAEAVMLMRNAWNLIILVERPREGEDDAGL